MEFGLWDVLLGLAVIGVVGYVVSRLFVAPAKPQPKKEEKPEKKKREKKVPPKEPGKFTRAEVAEHNTREDCWLIIDNKVYDVTSYIEDHRGGDAILNRAGDENSEGFHGPQHPSYVVETVKEFYIGDLVD